MNNYLAKHIYFVCIEANEYRRILIFRVVQGRLSLNAIFPFFDWATICVAVRRNQLFFFFRVHTASVA